MRMKKTPRINVHGLNQRVIRYGWTGILFFTLCLLQLTLGQSAPPTLSVAGHAYDAQGHGLAGVIIRFLNNSNSENSAVSTTSDGSYACNLPAGTYTVTVSSSTKLYAVSSKMVGSQLKVQGDISDLDFAATPAPKAAGVTVMGTVYNRIGVPIEGQTVTVAGTAVPAQTPMSNASGAYTCLVSGPNSFKISMDAGVNPTPLSPDLSSFFISAGQTGTVRQDFSIDSTGSHHISGVVLNKFGGKVEGAHVTVVGSAGGSARSDFAGEQVDTGPDGSFSFDDLLVASYKIKITTTNFSQLDTTVNLASGDQTDLKLILNATNTTNVVGHVVNTKGLPLSGIRVATVKVGQLPQNHSSSSDALGSFTLSGMPDGHYDIRVFKADNSLFEDSAVVQVEVANPQTVPADPTITIAATNDALVIDGKVLNEVFAPVAGVVVNIDGKVTPTTNAPDLGIAPFTTLDDGKFTFTVPPGTYRLFGGGSNVTIVERVISVGGNITPVLSASANDTDHRKAKLIVKVRNGVDAPVTDATVKIGADLATSTIQNNDYVFDSLPPGSYTVTGTRGGVTFTSSATGPVVLDGTNSSTVTLKANLPLSTVSGHIINEAGVPINGIGVTLAGSTDVSKTAAGSSGVYTLHVQPGVYDLNQLQFDFSTTGFTGHLPLTPSSVTIPPATSIPDVTVTVTDKKGVIAGTVRNSLGVAVPNILVHRSGTALTGAPVDVLTGGDGSYRFGNLPQGLYTVSIAASSSVAPNNGLFSSFFTAQPTVTVGVEPNNVATVNFTGAASVLFNSTGSVANLRHAPVRGIQVQLANTARTTSTRDDGGFRFDALPFGAYTLTYTDPSNRFTQLSNSAGLGTTSFTQPAGLNSDPTNTQPTTPEVFAAGPGRQTITVTIINSMGVPVPGTKVVCQHDPVFGVPLETFIESRLANNDGVVTFTLPAGNYKISVPALGSFPSVSTTSSLITLPTSVAGGNAALTVRVVGTVLKTITGVARNNLGVPVPSVVVHANGLSATPVATTGADGKFSFSLPPGKYVLQVKDARFNGGQANTPRLLLVAASDISPNNISDITLTGGIHLKISGHVRNSLSPAAAVFGAVVTLYRGDINPPVALYRGTTDVTGAYTISDVIAGNYLVKVAAKDGLTFSQVLSAVSAGSVNIDFVGSTPSGTPLRHVRGKITNASGIPVANVNVRVDQHAEFAALSKDDGTYDLAVPAGVYTVRAAQGTAFFVPSTVQPMYVGSDVNLNFKGLGLDHSITGQIVDTSMSLTGLANVDVTLTGGAAHFLAKTDAAGRFAVGGLPPGVYHVAFSRFDYHFAPESVDVTLSTTNVVLNNVVSNRFVVGAPNSADDPAHNVLTNAIVGTLINESGNPVPGIKVSRSGLSVPDLNDDATGTSVITDTNGQFKFKRVEPNRTYRLVIDGGSLYLSQVIYASVWVGKVAHVTAPPLLATSANRFTVSGRVVDVNGLPIIGATVTRNGIPPQVFSTTTNTFGEYRFPGLAPGKYTIRASKPAGYGDIFVANADSENQRDVQVLRGDVVGHDLRLHRAGNILITGNIHNLKGEKFGRIPVAVVDAAGQLVQGAVNGLTDNDGNYTVLVPADAHLTVTPQAFFMEPDPRKDPGVANADYRVKQVSGLFVVPVVPTFRFDAISPFSDPSRPASGRPLKSLITLEGSQIPGDWLDANGNLVPTRIPTNYDVIRLDFAANQKVRRVFLHDRDDKKAPTVWPVVATPLDMLNTNGAVNPLAVPDEFKKLLIPPFPGVVSVKSNVDFVISGF